MTIELSSLDPLTKELKYAHQAYLKSQTKVDRKRYFGLIQRVHDSFDLLEADTLNEDYYICQARRLAKGTSFLAPSAQKYCKEFEEFEGEFKNAFPRLKEKITALARAHNQFIGQFIPEFERRNPYWQDETVPLVPIE